MFQFKFVVLAIVSFVLSFVNTVSAQTQVYFNDFVSPVGSEWSNRTRSTTPVGGRRFLGEFGNNSVRLTLNNLPPHNQVRISFDLFVIRSWDGNASVDPRDGNVVGPDIWDLRTSDGLSLVHTTFSNIDSDPPLYYYQSYPSTFPNSESVPRSGAVEISILGYKFDYGGYIGNEENFDSLALGNIDGQNDWKAFINIASALVADEFAFSGNNSLKGKNVSGYAIAYKDYAPQNIGKQSFRWYATSNANANAQVVIGSKEDNIGAGCHLLFLPGTHLGIQAYIPKTNEIYADDLAFHEWHSTEIEWNKSLNQCRYKIDSNEWSQWSGFFNNPSSIERTIIYFYEYDDFYIDDYSFSLSNDAGDSVYHITCPFAHEDDNLSFIFSTSSLQALSDESWGLDNVKVEIEQPPQITHTPITSAIQNQKLTIEFEAHDSDGELESVKVYFRTTGSADFFSIELPINPDSSSFALEIPANLITLAGVDYYIEAVDSEGLKTTTPVYHIKIVDKWPVIIIPGVMGTHLNRINILGVEDRVWIDRTQACGTSPSDSFLNALQLDDDGHNSPGETILLGPILKSGFGINFYGNLIQYLIDHGNYRENVDLFDYPYDWRLDNALSAQGLSSKINTVLSNTGAEKVNIVAHSMGGLVARSYVQRYGEDKINKIIYLGTPHQGSTKSFNALAFDEGLHDLGLKFDCLTTSTLSNLAVTLPSIYQLLPRATFIYDWDEKHDIALSELYKNTSHGGFLRNDSWIALANTFHSNISYPIALSQYLIVGTGRATINRMVVRMEKNRAGGDHRCWFGGYSNGDDTVVQESAMAAIGSDITVFYTDRVSHTNIPNNENVDRLILDILQDSLNDPLPTGIALNPYDLPPEGLIAFNTCSPITMRISDEAGNINAEQQDGSIREDIPFSTFLNFQNSQGGILVRSQEYELHFDAIETGECSLYFEYISADGNAFDSAEYINFPVTMGTVGKVILNPDSTTSEILLDVDGDGNRIFNLLPNTEIPEELKSLFAKQGDINHDNEVDISDAIAILSYLFLEARADCPEAGKVNADNVIDISDAVYLLSYLFLGIIEKPKGLIYCQ